jgi:hypothetical protein
MGAFFQDKTGRLTVGRNIRLRLMGSDAIMYIPSFIIIGSCIQKLIGVIQKQTESMLNP